MKISMNSRVTEMSGRPTRPTHAYIARTHTKRLRVPEHNAFFPA